MQGAKVDEAARLEALARYQLLDTPPEERFDRFTRLASSILEMPIALVSLLDSDRQWFKSRVGLAVSETPREVAFCDHAIRSDDLLVVEDAAQDLRFSQNPLVTGAPHIRFYAGAPLITPDGFRLGTLCVIDVRPRSLSPREQTLLTTLSALMVETMELGDLAQKSVQDLLALERQHEDIAAQRKRIGELAAEMSVLAEENLAARIAAEAALGQKALFVAALVHELRTPLTAVLGFSELMEAEVHGPLGASKYVEFVRSIRLAGEHLLSLVNDLLDLAKLDAGKYEISMRPTDLTGLVASVVRMVSGLAKERAVTLTSALTDSPCMATVDPRAIQQILINLLSNAIKFTPAGGTVSVSVSAGEGGLRVQVVDTGQGIPSEDLARVLVPFEQAGSAAAGLLRGTGLGLAVSVELLRLHGTTLELTSELGVGTRASFVLPTA